jgi:hypothetical protein
MEPAEPPKPREKVFVFIAFLGLTLLVLHLTGYSPKPSPRPSALSDVMQLIAALKAYRVEYGHFPFGNHSQIVSVLEGDNPRRIVFLEFPSVARSSNGEFLDPWRTPYRIDTSDPSTLKVCSFGRNKRDDHDAEGSDDIVSWR